MARITIEAGELDVVEVIIPEDVLSNVIDNYLDRIHTALLRGDTVELPGLGILQPHLDGPSRHVTFRDDPAFLEALDEQANV